MRNKTLRLVTLAVALAAGYAPRAAHAGPTDWCGQLPALVDDVKAKTVMARDLVQWDNSLHPGVTGIQYALNDLNYLLSTVIPATRSIAVDAMSHGTPGGGAWGYQVHAQVIYAQGLDAELNDAGHWLIPVVYANGWTNSFSAVMKIVDAHNAATTLDYVAMRCYMSAAIP